MTARTSLASRLLFLVILFFSAGALHPTRAADGTPEAFVKSIYDNYRGTPDTSPGVPLETETDIRRYFEPSLATLLLDDRISADKAGDATDLDGDPFIDAQDWDIASIDIKVHHDGANRATATVNFLNFGEKKKVTLSLTHSPEGWRIHDIVWPGDEGTLRGLYKKNTP